MLLRKHLLFLLVPFAASGQTERLPEVLVQAQGPEPSATTILTGRELEMAGARDLPGIAERTPNLYVNDNALRGFGDVTTIRGLGNTPFFSGSGTAVYIDGIPTGDSFARALQLQDIESVEVYRGSQASTFGRNAEAGVIDVRTRRPGNQFRGAATASYGSYNLQDYRFNLSGPAIKDQLFFNISGYSTAHDGYLRNTFLDKTPDEQDALGGRFSLRWTPTPDWDIEIGSDIDRYDDGTQRLVPLTGDEYKIASNLDGTTHIDRNSQWLRIQRNFDWGKIISATGRQDWDLDPNTLDIDFSPAPIATTLIRQDQQQWTQELRAESPSSTPDPWAWKAGFFFLTSDTHGDTRRTVFGSPQTIYYNLEEENYALFGEATLRAVEKLDITVGLRLDRTSKSIGRTGSAQPLLFQPKPLGLFADRDYYFAAPRLELAYHATSNLTFYGKTGMGFKPGGYSAFTPDSDFAEYGEEQVLSGEVGIRASAFEDKLRVRLAGFWNEVDNYQVERSFTPTEYIIVNADEVTGRGVELEINASPIRNLDLAASFAYQLTEFDEYIDPFTGADLTGNRVPYSPDFEVRLAADYRLECGFIAHLEWLATGDIFYDDANTDFFKQTNYGLLNARLGFERDHWAIHLFARNLTGEKFFTSKTTDISAGVPNEPRTLGVSATLKF